MGIIDCLCNASHGGESAFAVFQQLEIDYIVGESHKDLCPYRSGPAAVLRMFGVTQEGDTCILLDFWFVMILLIEFRMSLNWPVFAAKELNCRNMQFDLQYCRV